MIQQKTPRERRKESKAAEIVRPKSGIQLPKRVRRLQRNAPVYALQGLTELSARLQQLTGRNIIDLNRVMEVAQFIYKQQELARRGPNYVVDDFGFDPE